MPTSPTLSLGLYALKPWYAARLRPVLDHLDARGVSPDAVSVAGVVAAATGGAVLALAPSGPLTALAVLVLVAIRLGCANLDGQLARRRPTRRFGSVVNELGDRLADLALLAGLASHLGGWPGGLLLLAASAPSWVAIATSAAGGARRNGGPMGKTERAAVCVLAAGIGCFGILGWTLVAGSTLTALLRLRAAARS